MTGHRTVVHLHIGTPKSGTTYLQNLLWQHRDALREQGVLYPGQAYSAHYLATLDLQETGYRGHSHPDAPGAWSRLVEEVRLAAQAPGRPGRVVISHELLSRCTPEQAKRALAELDFADVHLVLTLRDLVRQVPAAWQETVKNGFDVGFTDYLAALRAEPEHQDAHGSAFWRMQDAVDILDRWATDLPAERIHLVTVPPSQAPRELLWSRFATVLGLDPTGVPDTAVDANTSLGVAETALLRRLNQRLGTEIGWAVYADIVKHSLVTRTLTGRPGSRPVRLGREEHAWATERSNRMAGRLREHGCHVVGDLAELTPEPFREAAAYRHPDDVTEAELLEPALDTARALVSLAAEREQRAARLGERLEECERELAEARTAFRIAYERPALRHLAHRVGHRVKPVMTLLERSARARDRLRDDRGDAADGTR